MCLNFNTDGINLYFLCPFVCFFCLVLASYSSSFSKFGSNPFIQNIIISLSEILAIFPYLISMRIDKNIYKKKPKTYNLNKKSNYIKYEYNRREVTIKRMNLYQLFLLGFIDFIQSLSIFFGNLFNNNYQLYCWSSQIFFLCIFSKILLINKLYIHHIFSFILFFIFDILNIVFILIDEEIKYKSVQIIFIIISSICFSFELVYEKILFETYFVSIYKLCFLIGLSTLFYNLIASIIVTIISFYWDKITKFNCLDYFSQITDVLIIEISLIFSYMILIGLYNIFQFLTIKSLSPNYPLITQILLSFYISIMYALTKKMETITKIITIVINSICILILLVFLEIIEIKCFGLDQETKHNISNRSEIDKYLQSDASYNMPETGNRNDSFFDKDE